MKLHDKHHALLQWKNSSADTIKTNAELENKIKLLIEDTLNRNVMSETPMTQAYYGSMNILPISIKGQLYHDNKLMQTITQSMSKDALGDLIFTTCWTKRYGKVSTP
jgi:hypothetical protein